MRPHSFIGKRVDGGWERQPPCCAIVWAKVVVSRNWVAQGLGLMGHSSAVARQAIVCWKAVWSQNLTISLVHMTMLIVHMESRQLLAAVHMFYTDCTVKYMIL